MDCNLAFLKHIFSGPEIFLQHVCIIPPPTFTSLVNLTDCRYVKGEDRRRQYSEIKENKAPQKPYEEEKPKSLL